ncbi:DUF4258 domain-containing protein [Bacillus salitolerans]|uniref:DUF4258 domain-containing protein n=1 Tax=Bacillus salitolerans TaxID=1437434 RepID=A0ABW4LQ81_9BACI
MGNPMYQMKMRSIRKILMGGSDFGVIKIGNHSKKRLAKRGYTRRDIVCCLMNGTVHEVQTGFHNEAQKTCFNYVITGADYDNNPVVVVLAEVTEKLFHVVTVMPPTDHSRFDCCI